jgi:hypothetical protein
MSNANFVPTEPPGFDLVHSVPVWDHTGGDL